MVIGLVTKKEAIENRIEFTIPEALCYEPNYNIHPGSDCIFLSSQKPTEIIKMQWGLRPFWSKVEKAYPFAPLEGSARSNFSKLGIVQDTVFRRPIRENRGLVPIDYFIVETFSGTPYLVFLKEKKHRPIALACVWDTWKKEITDPLTYGFAVLTMPAYGQFENIGVKRMPVILDEYNYRRWVRTDLPLMEVNHMMLATLDGKYLNAFPVSPEILTNLSNDKGLIEAKGEMIEKEIISQYKQESYYQRRHKKEADMPDWSKRQKS
jgi:putative SOS response-associated peptidase YedK